MRRIERLAGALALGLGVMGMSTFGQGPPPPPMPGQPFPNLSKAEMALFQTGKTAFLQPQSVSEGLGPVFNERSCVQCHGGTQGPVGGSSLELVTRFGRIVNNEFDPMIKFGGPAIQAKGIGRFNGVNFVGEVVPHQATIVAHRRTIPLFGLGMVDAVPDSALLALSAHQHQTSPATAGVVCLVVDEATGLERVGRFGWKNQHATLFSFVADAYLNELGITTPVFPGENAPQGNSALLAANPAKTNPNDLDDDSIQQITNFLTLIAPPAPPLGRLNPTLQAGEMLFGLIGCTSCHQPTLQAGPSSTRPINGAIFAPYSDFLLHDMGSLGDGIVQAPAGPTQMRTAPLWGLQFEKSYLHDGRASTIDAAIRAHAGQGATAAQNYGTLNATQKAQLLAFLNSI
jgi:CxxC motif-containing protein (DUF1111 family)